MGARTCTHVWTRTALLLAVPPASDFVLRRSLHNHSRLSSSLLYRAAGFEPVVILLHLLRSGIEAWLFVVVVTGD